MSIAYLLVLLGIGILGASVWALFWAIDSGQFEELDSQGRIVLEDDEPPSTS